MLKFDYEEDRRFFEALLVNEYRTTLDEFADLFDFSPAPKKRKAFNRQRDKIFERLLLIHSDTCQLALPNVCTGQAQAIDHLIPISTNILNKRRGVTPDLGKKVAPQNFGSNHDQNLVLACHGCNNHKKHRFLERPDLQRLIAITMSR